MGAKSFMELVMTSDADWVKKWLSKIKAESMKEGKEEGIQKGREEGREEGKVVGEAKALALVARNLKSGGMSNKLISQYTGLSLAKIRKLVTTNTTGNKKRKKARLGV